MRSESLSFANGPDVLRQVIYRVLWMDGPIASFIRRMQACIEDQNVPSLAIG